MPEKPISFTIPKACPNCGRLGRVTMEHTLHGAEVQVQWQCGHCGNGWPVTADEGHEAPTDLPPVSTSEPLACPFCHAVSPTPQRADHGIRRYQCPSCGKFWATT